MYMCIIFNLFLHQGCPSHILSMPSMEWPYALGTPIDTGDNSNKTRSSKESGKCLTSLTSILSKSIVVRLDLDLLLDFISFNTPTILKLGKDEER